MSAHHHRPANKPETVCWLGRDLYAVSMLRAYTLLVFEIKLNRFLILNTSDAACVSYCRVCASVREGNPRALASGLLPVHTLNHTITCLLHQHAFVLCALRAI